MAKAKSKSKKSAKPQPVQVIFKVTEWDPDFYCRYWRASKNWDVNNLCGHRTQVRGNAVYPADFAGRKVRLWFLPTARERVGDDETKAVGEGTYRPGDNEIDIHVRVDRDTYVQLSATIGVRAHTHGVLVLQPAPRNQLWVSEAELIAELRERDLALIEGRQPAEPD
jgi:hypothetical protein